MLPMVSRRLSESRCTRKTFPLLGLIHDSRSESFWQVSTCTALLAFVQGIQLPLCLHGARGCMPPSLQRDRCKSRQNNRGVPLPVPGRLFAHSAVRVLTCRNKWLRPWGWHMYRVLLLVLCLGCISLRLYVQPKVVYFPRELPSRMQSRTYNRFHRSPY